MINREALAPGTPLPEIRPGAPARPARVRIAGAPPGPIARGRIQTL